jgi:hypothetical protein
MYVKYIWTHYLHYAGREKEYHKKLFVSELWYESFKREFDAF